MWICVRDTQRWVGHRGWVGEDTSSHITSITKTYFDFCVQIHLKFLNL